MAGAEYEVNISLNTKTIDAQLKALETRLSKISKVADPLTSNNEARARLQNLDRIRATGLIINRLGRELNKLEDQGVKVGKERSRIKRALKKLDEGLVESARAMNVETRDFIKQANKNLAIKEKAKKVEKETNKELVVNKRMQAENIDALANAQDKRFRLMQRINRLEEKGGKTAKLRKEMGRLTDQMSDRNFGTFKQITRTLSRQITLEESKLRTQKEQTTQINRQASGTQKLFQSIAKAGRESDKIFGPLQRLGQGSMVAGANEAKLLAGRSGAPSSPLSARPVTRASAAQAAQLVEAQVIARANLEKRATADAAAFKLRSDKRVLRAALNNDMIEYKQKVDDIVRLTNLEIKEGNRAGRAFDKELNRRIRARETGQKKRGQRAGDVVLGAGFPLLFGGGPGAVVGGALGGALGGGLAAQIGFSAIGQQFDAMATKAIELGQALDPATINIEKIAEASGFAGTETLSFLQKIEQYGDKAQAAELATELLEKRIGKGGVTALKNFGKQAITLGNNLSIIFTSVMANIAKTFGPLLDFLISKAERAAGVAGFRGRDRSTLTDPLDQLAFDVLNPTGRFNPFTGETPFTKLRKRAEELGVDPNKLREFAVNRAQKSTTEFVSPTLEKIETISSGIELPKDKSARTKRENMIAASQRRIQNLQAEAEKAKEISLIRGRIAAAEEAGDKQLVERLRGEEKAAEIVRKKARLLSRIPKDLDAQQRLTEELAINDTIRAEQLANQEATQRRIAKVMRDEQLEAIKQQEELYKQLGDTVKDGLVDSIKAAIDDTRTLGDALASMLSRLSDQFLQLAANMAFYGNAQGTLRNAQGQRTGGGIFGTIINALLPGPAAPLPTNSFAGVSNDVLDSVLSGVSGEKALGGPVSSGRSYLVGERGPELFVPGAQGNIVPNDAMSSTNVVVNVDASGTEVQGNQGNADQLGRLIGQAVQAELIKQKRPGGLLTR